MGGEGMGREGEGRGGRERRKGRGKNKNPPLQIGLVMGQHPQLRKPGKVGEFGKVG